MFLNSIFHFIKKFRETICLAICYHIWNLLILKLWLEHQWDRVICEERKTDGYQAEFDVHALVFTQLFYYFSKVFMQENF